MPDMPINHVLPNNEQEVNARIKWLTYLQGGGLSVLIAVVGIGASSLLFKVIMEDRDEDRQTMKEEAKVSREEDKEFRKQMLDATIDHTLATSKQTAVQENTNETLEEAKDAIVTMGTEFKNLAEEIKTLSENEKHTAERLNRVLENAWKDIRTAPPADQPK